MKPKSYKEGVTPKNNPRFYEVAHEFGLVVDNEIHLTRADRRDKAFMQQYEEKAKAYFGE